MAVQFASALLACTLAIVANKRRWQNYVCQLSKEALFRQRELLRQAIHASKGSGSVVETNQQAPKGTPHWWCPLVQVTLGNEPTAICLVHSKLLSYRLSQVTLLDLIQTSKLPVINAPQPKVFRFMGP